MTEINMECVDNEGTNVYLKVEKININYNEIEYYILFGSRGIQDEGINWINFELWPINNINRDPIISGYVKFDGCMGVDSLHFCSEYDLELLNIVVKKAWEYKRINCD